MKTNLILMTEKDEVWIEKYRAAQAALDANAPPPKGLKTLVAALLVACKRIRDAAGRIVKGEVPAQALNRAQKTEPIGLPATPTISDIVEEGMKRVEMLRRQSQKKTQPTKLQRKRSSNKSIA
jgi:hypothetical protein